MKVNDHSKSEGGSRAAANNVSRKRTDTLPAAQFTKPGKQARDMEEDKGENTAGIAQMRVSNSRSSIGRRIIITDNYYGDEGRKGTIIRFSNKSDDLFAVRFDDDRYNLWRVDYRDMDYLDGKVEKKEEGKKKEGSDPIMGWEIVGKAKHNNCTDYAFEGFEDLVFVNSLGELISMARSLGFTLVDSADNATVILFGKGKEYSHAIKKVDGVWYGVEGNDFYKYTAPGYPKTQRGDGIVAMLKHP